MTRRGRLCVLAVGLVMLTVPLAGTARAADPSTVKVGDAAEAWYATPIGGSCLIASLCPTLNSGGDPAGSLQVAATAGQEAARTYVRPDLGSLPSGAEATAGTLTLPISSTGTSNASASSVQVCLATAAFKAGASGSTDPAPAIDCQVSQKAVVGTKSLTVSLAPFLAAWAGGRTDYGLALVPDLTGASGAPTWHLSLDGSSEPGVAHPSATLELTYAAAIGSAPANGVPSVPAGVAPVSTSPVAASGPALSLPAVAPAIASGVPTAQASVLPSVAPIQQAAGLPAAPTAQNFLPAASTGKGFQYPVTMLLPLALGGGLFFIIRLLLSDATPRRRPVLDTYLTTSEDLQ